MGYTRGTQWTVELIKEKVLEVIGGLELDRMPSERECKEYFKDCKLTNAVTKRMGWYALAEEMGLPIKMSETYFGKKHEQLAQEQLISRGYEVRRMPQNFPYDLLVNDCVKIDVKMSKLYSGGAGRFYSFNLEKPYCTCDIYIFYLVNSDDSIKDILIIPSKFIATNTQIGVGEVTSKYYKYAQRWDYIRDYCSFLDAVV